MSLTHLMQKASDDMLKLAKAIDTADDLSAIQKELNVEQLLSLS